MKEKQFYELCRETSFLLAQKDIECLGKYGKINLLGTAITIFFDENISDDEIVLYAEIEELKTQDREKKLAILMGMNLLNSDVSLGVCALDPVRNIAILKKHIINLSDFSPSQFSLELTDIASQTTQIREQLPELILHSSSEDSDSPYILHTV